MVAVGVAAKKVPLATLRNIRPPHIELTCTTYDHCEGSRGGRWCFHPHALFMTRDGERSNNVSSGCISCGDCRRGRWRRSAAQELYAAIGRTRCPIRTTASSNVRGAFLTIRWALGRQIGNLALRRWGIRRAANQTRRRDGCRMTVHANWAAHKLTFGELG